MRAFVVVGDREIELKVPPRIEVDGTFRSRVAFEEVAIKHDGVARELIVRDLGIAWLPEMRIKLDNEPKVHRGDTLFVTYTLPKLRP